MIKGYDLSHFQMNTYKKYSDGAFYILKASEGVTYKDPMMAKMAEYFGKQLKKPLGFYHYAHPEKNSAKKEAAHFIKQVKDYLPCVLALDWEQKALACDIKWAREFLDIVYKETGIRPLFYCQSSYVSKAGSAIVDGNYGLWVARYSGGKIPPVVGKWGRYAIWQYTSTPVDCDYFNGTVEQFKKYGGMR